MPRRDRRLAVMQAAEALFTSRRYHEITTDDIAQAAHVALVKITGEDPGWRRGMTDAEVRALAEAAAKKLESR